MKKILILFTMFLISLPYISANLIISEIMYDLPGTDKSREWIEILNNGEEPIDLIGGNPGWRFFEEGGNHTFIEYSGGLTIQPKIYAIVADKPEFFLKDYPDFNGVLIDSSFSLRNTKEKIGLRNENKEIVFEIEYSNTLGANGNGNSLGLVNNELKETIPTPGKENKLPEVQEEIKNETIEESEEITQEENKSVMVVKEKNIINEIKPEQKSDKIPDSKKPENIINKNDNEISGDVIYESSDEKAKNLAIYIFVAVLILLIVYLIMEKCKKY